MPELTQKQADVYYFIKGFMKDKHYSPSVQEMANHFKVRPNAIQQRLDGLKKKGAVTTEKGRMRSTEPVKGFKVKIKE